VKRIKKLVPIVFLLMVILCLVGVMLIVKSNASISPVKAQELMQQAATSQSLGKVTDVTLSSPICSEAVLGNACRVDVQFKLDGKSASGWCTFGINQPQQCGITNIFK
jgi:hypothetical protein